jgi:hypothetical protein
VICPSCGEFISTDNPKVCPFCKLDLANFAFPASRSYGAPSKTSSPFAPETEVPPAGAEKPDIMSLQFSPSSGLHDSGPRRFIEKRLPRCPFCRTEEPQWEYAAVTGWLNRANFRCQKCLGVLSVPLESVTSWRNPTRLLGNLGLSEYLRVEGAGNSPGMEREAARLVGGEFSVERLRMWAERPDVELRGLAG